MKFNNKIYALFNSKFCLFSRGKVWKKHIFHIREGLEYMHFHDLRPVRDTIRINLNWRIDIMPHYANQISLLLIVQWLKHSKIGSSLSYLLAYWQTWACPFFFWIQNLKWWPANDEVWFIVSPSGCNQLQLILDKITMNFLDLKDKVLSNKIGQGIAITCIKEAIVPWQYKMKITRHKDLISYGK